MTACSIIKKPAGIQLAPRLQTDGAIIVINAATELYYFYLEKSSWFLASDGDNVLSGPFSTFEDLLTWAVDKEFVEPKPLWAIIDEREVIAG